MILNKKFFLFFIILLFTFQKSFSENTDIYKKIDLFGEVLEKISKEYVDEVDQSGFVVYFEITNVFSFPSLPLNLILLSNKL